MGEAKRRKALGLPTIRPISAQQLIDAGRQLPTPEHEKWAKPEDAWYPGKKDVQLEPFRPGEAEEFKQKTLASDDGFEEVMRAFKVQQSVDLLNSPVSYEDMASEPYDPVEAGAPYQGNRSFGRKNVYTCDNGHETVTVDSDEGVTPFMIVCPECKEYSRSKMYRVDQTLEASHEWYRPDTLDSVPPHNHDHVKRGGLIMRKIGGNEPEQAAKH